VSTEGKTIGEMLRAAREQKKLTIEEVNRETKISVQTLESLEQDDFDSFPSETYLKGFLRGYADFLGLDASRLWSMTARRPVSASGPGPSWDVEGSVREAHLGAPRILRRLVVPVLVIAVLVLALLLMRERRRAEPVSVHTPVSAPAAAVSAAG